MEIHEDSFPDLETLIPAKICRIAERDGTPKFLVKVDPLCMYVRPDQIRTKEELLEAERKRYPRGSYEYKCPYCDLQYRVLKKYKHSLVGIDGIWLPPACPVRRY